MLKVYPGIIHSESDGYWIEFPDLEGCQTQGDTIEEVTEMAQEALGLFLASSMDNDDKINPASDPAVIDPGDGIICLVSADPNKYRRDTRAVKKMLSIPAWLAKEAENNNLSLSRVLQDALKEKLNVA